MLKAKIAVLVSGNGTNLQALLDAEQAGQLPHGEIRLVVSSNPDAFALQRAQKAGKAAMFAADEAATVALLQQYQIDVVVLAGYLKILSPAFVRLWPQRILNVHPSLLPAFGGPGFYGLRVHQAALERGVKVTGATVHLVNETPDGGPILRQQAVAVRPGDTPEILQKRVMEEAEWRLLPAATEDVCRSWAESMAPAAGKEPAQ